MRAKGFTLIELLVVMAIIGVIGSIAFSAGRRLFAAQEAGAAVNSVRQLMAQGATAAASRGVGLDLVRTGNTLTLQTQVAPIKVIRTVTLPNSVSSTLPTGTSFKFSAPGKVDSTATGLAPTNQFTMTAGGKTYTLLVSLIGEVKVTP